MSVAIGACRLKVVVCHDTLAAICMQLVGAGHKRFTLHSTKKSALLIADLQILGSFSQVKRLLRVVSFI